VRNTPESGETLQQSARQILQAHDTDWNMRINSNEVEDKETDTEIQFTSSEDSSQKTFDKNEI